MMLSKSSYMLGLQCPLYLWAKFNKPSLIPGADASLQHRFDEGHIVGGLAKKYFGGGIDIPIDEFKLNIEKTQELVKGKQVLFEPGFFVNDLFSRIDVLKPVEGGWDLIEVKSSTKIKPEHYQDVSFQRHVCSLAGIKIIKCHLMHINRDFVKDGEIDFKKFFRLVDITEEVDEAAEGIEDRIKAMFNVISGSKPSICVGGHCSSPYQCPIEECWKGLPPLNVFDLYRGGRKCEMLFTSGVAALKDIPLDFKLTVNQKIQAKCARTGKPHVDHVKLIKFLKQIKEPVSYLDFETFSFAVPVYEGTKPYQQIPFQFSLHVGSEHHSFLAQGSIDPRPRFIEELKKVLPSEGSVLVYSQTFEQGRLEECSELMPVYKEWVSSVVLRMVDLLDVFRGFIYYHPNQKGSASIKFVLPAILGRDDYKKLEINNGGAASLAYIDMYFAKGMSDKDITKNRTNLEKYCELDTKAMVDVLEELRGLIN